VANCVLWLTSMARNIVVLSGSTPIDRPILRSVAREFGWTVDIVHDLRDIDLPRARSSTAAVLFHRHALGHYSWSDAVRRIRRMLPEALLVVCHGVSQPVNWPELAAAGAFHALKLPLKECEVRQSFGFIWEADKRRLVSGQSRVGAQPGNIRRASVDRRDRLAEQSQVHG